MITNQVMVKFSRWLKGSNMHLTYHVYQIRHDAFDLNNVYVLNLQTQEKNNLIKTQKTMLDGSKGGKEREREKEKRTEGGSKGRRTTGTEGVKKGTTGRRVEGRSGEGRRKGERKGEGLRRKLQYRNTLSISETFSNLDSCQPTTHVTGLNQASNCGFYLNIV